MTFSGTDKNNLPTWVYWQGEKSPLIELCIESIQRHNPGTQVLDAQSAEQLGAGDVISVTEGRSAFLRADVLRLWLLKEFGGAWIDADCISLRRLDMIDMLADHEFVGFGNPNTSPACSNAIIASRPHGTVVTRAYNRAMRAVQSGRHLAYGEIGQSLLCKLWQRNPDLYRRCDRWRYAYIHWSRPQQFLRPKISDVLHEQSKLWNPQACTYHLTGKAASQFASQSQQELLNGNTFLSFLLRRSA